MRNPFQRVRGLFLPRGIRPGPEPGWQSGRGAAAIAPPRCHPHVTEGFSLPAGPGLKGLLHGRSHLGREGGRGLGLGGECGQDAAGYGRLGSAGRWLRIFSAAASQDQRYAHHTNYNDSPQSLNYFMKRHVCLRVYGKKPLLLYGRVLVTC